MSDFLLSFWVNSIIIRCVLENINYIKIQLADCSYITHFPHITFLIIISNRISIYSSGDTI